MVAGKASGWKANHHIHIPEKQQASAGKDKRSLLPTHPFKKPSSESFMTQSLASHWSELCLMTTVSCKGAGNVLIPDGHMCFAKNGVLFFREEGNDVVEQRTTSATARE